MGGRAPFGGEHQVFGGPEQGRPLNCDTMAQHGLVIRFFGVSVKRSALNRQKSPEPGLLGPRRMESPERQFVAVSSLLFG
jgi:hypothetical protein